MAAAHGWWGNAWPDWLVDGSQVVGAVVGTVALLVALNALRIVSRERRITHELEVLREMSGLRGSVEGLEAMSEVFFRLQLLRDPRDFPLTRAAMDMGATRAARFEYSRRYPAAPPPDEWGIDFERFRPLQEDGAFTTEWEAAVARRVAPGRLARACKGGLAWLCLGWRCLRRRLQRLLRSVSWR